MKGLDKTMVDYGKPKAGTDEETHYTTGIFIWESQIVFYRAHHFQIGLNFPAASVASLQKIYCTDPPQRWTGYK